MPSTLHHLGFSSVEQFNVSEVRSQRWENSAKEDRKRLELCWGYLDCGDCHRSKGFCGWCPISSTCLPLPTHPQISAHFPLLSPLFDSQICALSTERFELRTAGLGCQVSTITFLTSVVTVFCTVFGLAVLWLLFKVIRGTFRMGRAWRGGWMIKSDGKGETWVRKGGRWGRLGSGKEREGELGDIDTGIKERPRWVWWRWLDRRGRSFDGERRALLR
ncbi:hypothetical protein GQ43DRAFT_239674 [Delitschia confertaspora ATCC 74209]|uniref:PSI domain-containing protein n=1 Tax=Delitschia confertaspora ATCC 74209 TaxID=1513339 RepID=A0A9P4JQC4_9PLEO|nr:hypothetical protein GQ43DRAFT_239674 [Delitschia confertaspora ATCC 74209]